MTRSSDPLADLVERAIVKISHPGNVGTSSTIMRITSRSTSSSSATGERAITRRIRDNFPNPVTSWDNPYVPVNSPALDDLFSMFNFQ